MKDSNRRLLLVSTSIAAMFFMFVAISTQDSDARYGIGKLKDTVDDVEDIADCMVYNSAMTEQYSQMGKIWNSNPDCDPDKQYIYDELNGIPTTYEEDKGKDAISALRDDAYEDE